MSENNYIHDGGERVEVEIAWPVDAYVGAKTVNQFTYSIVEGEVFIAFGHVPPLPGTPIPVPTQYPIPVVGAYAFELSMLLNLRESLNKFVEANPGLVGSPE
ncbi:hypothetical protein FK268_09410 [Tsukamurella sputi]|uniref:Uncharacterized protein n=1 Tax=Tsukamurella sputi TaxID=2591848 RepID=A0A5C5RQU3_9ACTN|nr:hypothetical protein [Tsukamurella sputi]TWS25396.1 hypothetical protein FK268_09410 [Tsukamurella sputi]